MSNRLDDQTVRIAAFDWLAEQVRLHGDVLPRTLLQSGFQVKGQRVPLQSRQGIFKPQVLPEIPLSITTTPSGPSDDAISADGLIRYAYRGSDPRHSENVGLRTAMRRGVPLVYFLRVVPGQYLAVWPVYIVGDDPKELTFTVAADDISYTHFQERGAAELSDTEASARRSYITSTVLRRVHQRAFRERVLQAYSERCALCRLKHRELLDAAHIVPDGEPGGDPVVPNGLALCKLHHAAFDGFFFGIRPDYVIEVRNDVLREEDGPMLIHGIQETHGRRILTPRSARLRPDPDLLDRRYQRFRERAA